MSSNQRDGAVVTGAASGIGRAIAAGLAADGFSVVVADLDEVSGRAAAKEIAAASQGRAIFQRVDVTDRTTVSAAIDACTRQFGRSNCGAPGRCRYRCSPAKVKAGEWGSFGVTIRVSRRRRSPPRASNFDLDQSFRDGVAR